MKRTSCPLSLKQTFSISLLTGFAVFCFADGLLFADAPVADVQNSLKTNQAPEDIPSERSRIIPRRRVSIANGSRVHHLGIENWDMDTLTTLTVSKTTPPKSYDFRSEYMSLLQKHSLESKHSISNKSMSSETAAAKEAFCAKLASGIDSDSQELMAKSMNELFQELNVHLSFGGTVWGEQCTYFNLNYRGKHYEGLTNANLEYLRSVDSFQWGHRCYSLSSLILGEEELDKKHRKLVARLLGQSSLKPRKEGPIKVVSPSLDPCAADALTVVLQYYLNNYDSLVRQHKKRLADLEWRKANPPLPKPKPKLEDLVYNASTLVESSQATALEGGK